VGGLAVDRVALIDRDALSGSSQGRLEKVLGDDRPVRVAVNAVAGVIGVERDDAAEPPWR